MPDPIKYLAAMAIGFTAAAAIAFAPPALAQDSQAAPQDASEIQQLEDALTPYVMPKSGPFRPDTIAIAQSAAISAWAGSPHANASSAAFSHWNSEGEIPPVCAGCHSGAGFRDLHGLDGSDPGMSNTPTPAGGVVDCDTCHNPGLSQIGEIRFPSGLMHPVATAGEVPCLTCHQGRAAGASVQEALADKPEDLPDSEIRFVNPHYAVAAASWLGGYGASGYHYPGKDYSGRFFHARPVTTCASCHDPHSLKVAEQTCLTCHQESATADIRLSRLSYDGSNDLNKGISADIAANAGILRQIYMDYAADVAGMGIVHDAQLYPYFFADANGDGRADQRDGKPVAYNTWTPRLLKAVYNWKFVTSDAGIYAHNPHYALELLHDSIEDLAVLMNRDFAGMGIQR